MAGEVVLRGITHLLQDLEKRQVQIEANRNRAAHSAANVFRRFVRLEARAIRGKGVAGGLTPTGRKKASKHRLERDVKVLPTATGWTVKDTAPHAWLVVHGHKPPSGDIMPTAAKALSFGDQGHPVMSSPGGSAKGNPFVHRGFVAAGADPVIAARVTLFGGPEAPEG